MKNRRFAPLMVSVILAGYATALGLAGWVRAEPAKEAADAKPAEQKKPEKPKKPTGPAAYALMDYGPVLEATIDAAPPGNTTLKGIVIKLNGRSQEKNSDQACVLFDTEMMRYSAGWTGGFLDWKNVAFGGQHGVNMSPVGSVKWSTRPGPGWAVNDDFADPRPDHQGHLPADHARYRGLYLHGEQAIVSFTVGGDTAVLEMPGIEKHGDTVAFTRTIGVGPHAQPLTLLACSADLGEGTIAGPADDANHSTATLTTPPPTTAPATSATATATASTIPSAPQTTVVGVESAPAGAKWEIASAQIEPTLDWNEHVSGKIGTQAKKLVGQKQAEVRLTLAPSASESTFKLVLWRQGAEGTPATEILKAGGGMPNLHDLTKGGPPRWPETVAVEGKLGDDAAPYTVDTITVPEKNPYRSWMRLAAFDFFPGGTRAALCTWSGDVWTVDGIDDKLDHLVWKRYATGLFQPLGLKIVDGKVYVLGRDGITILHDLNGDGEADFYENFNNDVIVTPGFHEFAFDLQTDPQGNYYFTKAGPVRPGGRGFERIGPDNGTLLRVSKDGSKLDVVATGLRAANGMAIGPDGTIVAGDNEGTWVPSSKVMLIKPGDYCGVADTAQQSPVPTHQLPITWLSHNGNVDNSCGGQAFVTGDRWGPFKGMLLHTSYGQCSLFVVPFESVEGQVQGGAIRLPVSFDSGIMRLRFNDRDGQLYACGLRGWQTTAGRDACFQRVRYTGKPITFPNGIHVLHDEIDLSFTNALDKATAEDPQNWSVEEWNYAWTSAYGSPEFTVKDPKKEGHDSIDVESASLSADGRTVRLKIADLAPVMQMSIKYHLRGIDGSDVSQEVQNTINVVPSAAGGGAATAPTGPPTPSAAGQ